jgi:GxxExxY protein
LWTLLVYDGITFDEGLRLDVPVEELIVCELKAVETMDPVFLAQLMTQLKLTKKRLGFLINFNVPRSSTASSGSFYKAFVPWW